MRRSRLLQDLKPFFLRWLQQGAEAGLTVGEGPGISVVGGYQVGLGGDMVLLYDDDRTPVAEYATITLALAAADSGDVVQPQAGTYAEDITIPAGVEVVGAGRDNTVIAGTVTGGAGATLRNVTVQIDGDDAGLLYGVAGPASGEFGVEDCRILVDNATGDAAALYSADAGTIKARECLLRGVSMSGSGYAAYRAGGGAGTLIGGELQYSTAPVYEG